MKSIIPSRIAEMLYALAMGTFGVLHLKDAKIWVYITGAALIAAALAIIINTFKRLACYLLAVMLLIFVFTLHLEPAMDGNLGNLLKDTGLAMGALIIGNNAKEA